MRKIGLISVALLCLVSFGLHAQMSDDQVLQYVQSALASGKSQDTISKELLARGVTMEQAERIKSKFQNQGADVKSGMEGVADGYVRRSGASDASRPVTKEDSYEEEYWNVRKSTENQRKKLRKIQLDNNRNRSEYDIRREQLNQDEKADFSDLLSSVGTLEYDDFDFPDSLKVFGHDIFNGRDLSFEPNENLATPESYQLGPGDQLQIEIFGYNEDSYVKTISPEGTINISRIGQVQLNGLTIKEAREKLRRALVSKYASIGGSSPNTTVSITLRDIRTIQVNVMGEVETPGTFRLSPFATVFNALYKAGGVSEEGSMRAIKVIRGGELFATVDVYGYLFNGRSDSDVTLKEGDVVIVPPYVNMVQASGQVKRPMFYELNEGETLSDLVQFSGGFTSSAHKDDIRVIRQQGAERRIFTVKGASVASFVMADGDEVYVNATLERFANKVEIKGSVFRPGMYELGGEIATVRQLVRGAGGLKEDAFTGRAVLVREKEDLSFESLSIDLAGILSGAADDVLLRKNDILTISSNKDLLDPGTLTINGYVRNPGVFPYADNMTVEDLILLAGGLMDGASYSRVDVARRVSDPYSTMPKDTIGETFSFAIDDKLAVVGGERFVLQPYDVVSVRRSPAYRTQKFVRIEGEVAFPGEYVLLTEDERLSDLLRRAGGKTGRAFLHGSTLTRRMNEEERNLQNSIRRIATSGAIRDSLDLDQVIEEQTNTVGIELDKAVEMPGSEYDLILRDGDRIFVPEELTTVRVSGAVMYPNTTVYIPGKGLDYYIDAAGGYGERARWKKTFIVYMNGRVKRASAIGAKIEPGCEIVVPPKPDRAPVTATEVMSMGTSAASLATMLATLVNLFTR